MKQVFLSGARGACQVYTQQTSVTCCHQREAGGDGPSLAGHERGPGSTYRPPGGWVGGGGLHCFHANGAVEHGSHFWDCWDGLFFLS